MVLGEEKKKLLFIYLKKYRTILLERLQWALEQRLGCHNKCSLLRVYLWLCLWKSAEMRPQANPWTYSNSPDNQSARAGGSKLAQIEQSVCWQRSRLIPIVFVTQTGLSISILHCSKQCSQSLISSSLLWPVPTLTSASVTALLRSSVGHLLTTSEPCLSPWLFLLPKVSAAVGGITSKAVTGKKLQMGRNGLILRGRNKRQHEDAYPKRSSREERHQIEVNVSETLQCCLGHWCCRAGRWQQLL